LRAALAALPRTELDALVAAIAKVAAHVTAAVNDVNGGTP